jgi:hypothetical protein
MKLYSVKQYFNTTFNSEGVTNAATIEGSVSTLSKLLKSDNSYHIRINSELPCVAFGDFDKCPSESLFDNFLVVLCHVFQVEKSDISYTLSRKESLFSYHWIIKSIETNCMVLKDTLIRDVFSTFKTCIDLSVYCNKWFRMPNQTNENKSIHHEIIVGKMKHFFIHHIDDTTSKFNMSTENPVLSKPEKSNVNTLTEIKRMILKMPNFFDTYDEWCKMGFIIYNESSGSDEGYNLFNELSKEFKNYDEKGLNKVWYGIKPKEIKKLTIKTLRLWYNKIYPNESCIYSNEIYVKQKEIFEQRIFKLDEPFNFVKINNGGQIELMNLKVLKEWSLGDYEKVEIIVEDNKKVYDFIDVWKDDPNKRKYNKIVFDPSDNNENSMYYNLWKGFNMDDTIKPVVETESKFLWLLRRICNDDGIYDYVKQWIAHIIQKPYKKTNIAIVLYSDTKGVGKNCIIDGICKLLKNYTGKVGNIEDITRNFNAHLVNKLFISGDEICAKATSVSNKLKEVITRTEQNLEKKGKDAIEVDDYTNWLFTTNNYDAFKIENGDRRLSMINCLEEKLSSVDSIAFYKEINNPTEINKLFNYFKVLPITYKIGIDAPPVTLYKRNLEYNNKPAYIQMIYKEPMSLIGHSFTSSQLLKLSNEYAKSHYLSQYNDVISFGKKMSKIFKEYKKRGNTANIYSFKLVEIKQVRKTLKDHDSDYYNYVNHIDLFDDEEKPEETKHDITCDTCDGFYQCKKCSGNTDVSASMEIDE